jgi:hypothetical protein
MHEMLLLLLRAQRRYPAKAQHLMLDPSPPLHYHPASKHGMEA